MSTGDIGLRDVKARRRGSLLADWARRGRRSGYSRAAFTSLAIALDVVTITASALASGIAYHTLYYHVGGMFRTFAALGLAVSLPFVVYNAFGQDYALAAYLGLGSNVRRAVFVWNTTFLTTLIVFFLTKESAAFSRASVLLFYITGLFALVATRCALVWRIKADASVGRIAAVRAVLVGDEEELEAFLTRYEPWTVGIDVVASAVLRSDATLKEDLALAAASARVLRPDDIFILLPWTRTETIDACVDAFMQVPAAIHLGPQRVLDRFAKARVARIGAIASLHLVRHPLTILDRVVKRAFDVVAGCVLLVCLLPLFGVLALAIKLDSKGPVLFLQRRYGFNQETFRILKFRTMRVIEDGGKVRGVTRDDPRVTRVGRILRRANFDELPQLVNVILGQMSLVGPRPHALVHNQQYERTIADYARRHNVKPGMTGWAQVHGLRGEISSEAKMRARLEHDLYYIDNWSIGLDMRILAVTLLSPKAFENAY